MSKGITIEGHLIDVVNGEVLKNKVIHIIGGRIEDIKSKSNATKQFILPGLIDAHVHLVLEPLPDRPAFDPKESSKVRYERVLRNGKQALLAGITTVRDCGFPNDDIFSLRRDIEIDPTKGSRIIACGPLITTPKGHGRELGVEVRGAKEMRKVCESLVRKNVDFIKLVNNDPEGFSVEEIRAAVEVAHQRGIKVACHVYQSHVLERIVEARVNTIEHFVDTTDSILQKIKENKIIVVPTYVTSVDAVEHPEANVLGEEEIGDEMTMTIEDWAKRLEKGTKQLISSGVAIATGTDAGFLYTDFASNIREILLLVELGMTRLRALQSATIIAARAVGCDKDLGSLEVGKFADVVIYEENPLEDLEVLEKPKEVYKNGIKVL